MDSDKQYQISISQGSILWGVFWVALALATYYLRDIVLMVLTSVVVASAAEPAARWFVRYKIPRVLGVLFTYVAFFSLLILAFYFVLPILISEISGATSYLPTKINAPASFGTITDTINFIATSFTSDFTLKDVVGGSAAITGKFLSLAGNLFSGLFTFVMIVVISFYLAVQERGVENFLRIATPLKNESYVLDLWRRTQNKIGGWAQGQMVLAIVIGPLVYLGLMLLGIKYALVLALIAAIFEVIPIFGPVLAAVPAVLLGFSESFGLGMAVLLFYVIIQQFENHLIYPLVVKKIIGVPPIIAIVSLIVGAQLAGFLGVVLSVPAAALLMEVANDLEKSKHRENA